MSVSALARMVMMMTILMLMLMQGRLGRQGKEDGAQETEQMGRPETQATCAISCAYLSGVSKRQWVWGSFTL